MSEATNSLFVETAIAAVTREMRTGVLPYQSLQTMLREHEIWGQQEITPAQLQPASPRLIDRVGSGSRREPREQLGAARDILQPLGHVRPHLTSRGSG